MRKLKEFLAKHAEKFEHGGKYERLYPVWEMIDTILFTPDKVTKGKTHARDGIDLKRIMTTVIVALIPCVIMALYNTGLQTNLVLADKGITPDGWRAAVITMLGAGFNPNSIADNFLHGAMYFLPLYIATLVVGDFWEVLFSIIRKHEVGEAFLVTSLLYPLILPPSVPIWQAMVALSIGLVLGKEVFGGTGRNIVNPALISRAVLFFAYPASMSGDVVWVAVDSYSRATPLGLQALEGTMGSVTFMDAFLGFIPGSMGETSALACLFGIFVLVITGVGSWRVIVSTIAGLVATVLLFNAVGSETNPMFSMPVHWHLVLGGFAFGTAFMVTDPVSSAQTNTGRYIYGFLIGALCALIRVVNPAYPEGMMLAILFANVFAPVIDHVVITRNIKRRRLQSAS